MRIDRFSATHFGQLPDIQLELAKLSSDCHLLYGPNETGKSTLRRAIHSWLFGRGPDTDISDSRSRQRTTTSGTVRLANNDLITFTRTLKQRGQADAIIEEDHGEARDFLVDSLDNGDAQQAQNQYFLDNQLLSEFSQLLKEQDGLSFLTSATGQKSVQEGIEALRKQREELFIPRGQKQAIVDLLKKLEETAKELAEKTTQPREVQDLRGRIEDQEKNYQSTKKQLATLEEKRSSLHRIHTVRGVMEQLNKLKQQETAYQDLPEIPSAEFSQLKEIRRSLRELSHKKEQLELALEQSRKKQAQLKTSAHWDNHRQTIQRLSQGFDVYTHNLKDQNQWTIELQQQTQSLNALAQQLGIKEPLTPEHLTPAQTHLAEAQELVQQYRRLDEQLTDLKQRHQAQTQPPEQFWSDEQRALARSLQQTAQTSLDDDIAELTKKVSGLSKNFKKLQDPLAAYVSKDYIANQLRGIDPPEYQQIAQFNQAYQNYHSRYQELTDALNANQAKLDQAQAELKNHQNDGVSEEDYAELLSQRNSLMAQLASQEQFTSVPQLLLQLEQIHHKCDQYLNQIQSDLERQLEQREATNRLTHLTEQHANLEQQRATLKHQHQQREEDWQALWPHFNHPVGTPTQMTAFAKTFAEARQIIEEGSQTRQRLEELEERRTSIIGSIQTLCPDCDTSTLRAALAHLDAQLQKAQSHHDQREQRAQQEQAYQQQKEQLKHTQQNLTASWKTLGKQFLGTWPEEPSNTTLNTWQELLRQAAHQTELETKLSRTSKSIREYSDHLKSLSKEIFPDRTFPAEADLIQALRDFDEIEKAKRDQQSLLTETLNHQESEHTLHNTKQTEEQQRCNELLQQWNLTLNTWDANQERLEAKEKLEIERTRLLQQVEPFERPYEQLVAEAQEFDQPVDVLRKELDQGREQLQIQLTDYSVALKELNAELERLKKPDENYQHLQQKMASLEADLEARVQDYVALTTVEKSLEFASNQLLDQAFDQLRTRASDYFARMTLGNYSGLEIKLDGQEVQVTCLHQDGPRTVDELSEGTRDQLYLAIRLAYLSTDPSIVEPLPLVLDDILVHFDDQRARATLEVLRELGAQMQILFFTHHAHLKEMWLELFEAESVVELSLVAV